MEKNLLTITFAIVGVAFSSLVSQSVSADVLKVPKTSDEIIVKNEEHIRYVDMEGVQITASDGTEYEAPLTVDTQILSTEGNDIEGVTEYITDLSDTKSVDKTDNLLSKGFSYIGGSKVSAQDYEYGTSRWDSTISVKISTRVFWTQSGFKAKVTKVTGGYYVEDIKVGVKGSSLRVYTNGLGDNQETSFDLGKSQSWSRTVSHHFVKSDDLSSGGAVYTVNLLDSNSSWNVAMANQGWFSWGN